MAVAFNARKGHATPEAELAQAFEERLEEDLDVAVRQLRHQPHGIEFMCRSECRDAVKAEVLRRNRRSALEQRITRKGDGKQYTS